MVVTTITSCAITRSSTTTFATTAADVVAATIIMIIINTSNNATSAAVTMIKVIIITTSITTPIPAKSAAPLVITTIIRRVRLRSQGYVLLYLPRSWDVVPDWEKECERVAEALNLLRRPQSPWTTLNRVSFGKLGLTHTEREAVYEAVIHLTRTRPEKAKGV